MNWISGLVYILMFVKFTADNVLTGRPLVNYFVWLVSTIYLIFFFFYTSQAIQTPSESLEQKGRSWSDAVDGV